MEHLLSHHWRLPKSVCIPIIKHRLEFCFLNNQSLVIELDVYDCSNVIGNSIPFQVQQRLLSFVNEADEFDVNWVLSAVRIGSSDIFSVLQREWYVTSGTLFISAQIGQTEFFKGLAHLHHQLSMYSNNR